MTELKYNGERVFRVGQKLTLQIKPKQKEENEVHNAEKQIINELAASILARAKDEERQLAASQPGSPPPVILAKTQSQEEVERHYQQPETIKTNVNGVKGLESYAPPPCLLARED